MPAASGTREAILRAARGALVTEGCSGASLRRIAAAAGVTHAAVYKHFTDKQALFRAIAEHDFAELVEQMRAAVPNEADPRVRLASLLEEFIRSGLGNPNLYEFLFWTLPATSGAELATTNEVFTLLRSAVAACGPAGDRSADPERLAGFLLTAAIGYVARAFVRPTTARERVGEYVAFLLGGTV